MINVPKAPRPENPVMIDKVIAYIQDRLVNNVGWLNHAFGRAQRLVTNRDRKTYYYPGVYISDNEYLNVLPGQDLGNRTFFVTEDPQTVDFVPFRFNKIKCPISLVLWCDLSTIYPEAKDRNTEEIKRQILRVLTMLTMPSGSSIAISKIYEQAENIFRGYSLKEIDSQFLMQPFAGLRIDGYITYQEPCL